MKEKQVIALLFFLLCVGHHPTNAQKNVDIAATAKAAVDAFFKMQDFLSYCSQRTIAAAKIVEDIVASIKGNNPSLEIDEFVKEYVVQTLEGCRPKSTVNGTHYDLIIDASSLQNISLGWSIINNGGRDSIKKGQTVGTIGPYDSGKTFIINLLDDITLPSGITNVTPALAFYKSRSLTNVIFLDSQGSHRLVSSSSQTSENSSIEDRIATDHFITDVVIHLSDVLLYIVGPLHTRDVIEINKVYKKRMGEKALREMMVIHNFMDYSEKGEVEKHIHDDILQAFPDAEPLQRLRDSPNCIMWVSHGGQVRHVVMAKSKTPAGDSYNECARGIINDRLRGLTQIDTKNPIEDVKTLVENMLPDYFVPPNSTPGQPPNTLYQRAVNVIEVLGRRFFGVQPHLTKTKIFPLEIVSEDNATMLRLKRNSIDPPQLTYLPIGDQGVPDSAFAPSYDIYIDEDTGTWQLLMDLPGLEQSPIVKCVNTNTRLLVISGQRAVPPFSTHQLRSWGNNRKYGRFKMTISLPDWLVCETAKSKRTYKDGLFVLSATRVPLDPEDEDEKEEL